MTRQTVLYETYVGSPCRIRVTQADGRITVYGSFNGVDWLALTSVPTVRTWSPPPAAQQDTERDLPGGL